MTALKMAGGSIVNQRILIADSDEVVCYGLATILSTAGYTALVATDGVAVVEQARRHQPHLVMLDLCLPAGNALELVKTLRRLPGLMQLPVIVFASRDYRMKATDVFDAGANVFLPKPFNRQILFSVIGRLLAADKSVRTVNSLPSIDWRPGQPAPRFLEN